MNRLSDDSSRRKIPVRFWELLHTSEIKKTKYIYFVMFFSSFLKTLLLHLTMKKRPKNPRENTQKSKMNTGPNLQLKHSQLAQDSIWFNTID